MFKIRRKSDGLFSNGKTFGRNFNSKGKSWSSRSGVTLHLGRLSKNDNRYDDCEVVEFKIELTEVNTISVRDYIEDFNNRKQAVIQKKTEKNNAERIKMLRAEADALEKLQ